MLKGPDVDRAFLNKFAAARAFSDAGLCSDDWLAMSTAVRPLRPVWSHDGRLTRTAAELLSIYALEADVATRPPTGPEERGLVPGGDARQTALGHGGADILDLAALAAARDHGTAGQG